jgi:flagellar biosynthesis protein FlhG
MYGMKDQAEQLRSIVSTKPEKSGLKIITITSGKGGVGKSNFVVNTAISLKNKGYSPLILDADFGLANIEIILGETPKYNLSHMIKDHWPIENIINTSHYGVPFISGGSGVKDMLFLSAEEIEFIGEELKKLQSMADILLIDTGAGINDVILKFGALADEMFVVVTPEPTSITDAYALIKTLVKDFGHNIVFKIVLNKTENKKEGEQVFDKLYAVANNFLGIKLQYAGCVPYDEKIFHAVKHQVPVIAYAPKGQGSNAYIEIAQTMGHNSKPIEEHNHYLWITKFKKIFKNKKNDVPVE